MAVIRASDEARRLLGECMLFRELDPVERSALFTHLQVRSCVAGENIFLMGSAADSLIVS